MSVEQIATSLPIIGGKFADQHPLGPLTAAEISESARLIKGLWPTNTNLQFKVISLKEPDKADLVPFLAAEHAGKTTPTIQRRSFVVYYIRNTVRSRDLVFRQY
jgi:primary-amine oxidase